MNSIKINCPAKINLLLEIINKREDGFHNIKSVMQTISLYDTLEIKISKDTEKILLSGNSQEIPYNEKNLVYKAADLFYRETGLTGFGTEIYIDKRIPIAAGLAGGSTDAAGTIFGLNELFRRPLDRKKLHALCETLGSDLNVCLEGGCILATSRGEVIQKLKPLKSKLTLIKPKNLGISAREAYTKYSNKTIKPRNNMAEKMLDAIDKNDDFSKYLYNDLEYAVFDDYKELQKIKQCIPNAVMSGSGSTYFVLGDEVNTDIPGDDYQIIKGLEFIETGVAISQCNNFVTN
ncbi:TPA: 4-(cytidine 5'-diphospho)-2-C-methyl-D-erythritol kinase [Candidatus Gastranaerophilales bacterium HUM_10]|nr:MAG TPA: 4-(cytidine 5'-diphospho)-2-C-methyl-D-erythritol kinase [Candidatus Gastranaerophilales bacterium HUM_10]